MIEIRPARLADAAAIGRVHVQAWRSAYPGILPDDYLAALHPSRQAGYYAAAISAGAGVFVASAMADRGTEPLRVVGFTTVGPARTPGLGEGEIETLYVLDDWREQGIGRRLLRGGAEALRAQGCSSAFLWVLRDNPTRFFYRHLGGRLAMAGETRIAGTRVPQVAYVWNPIEKLIAGLLAG